MTRVLYIEGSPNKDYSASIDVCNAFLDAYRHASRSRDTDARHLESGDTRIRRSRAGREICGTERQRVDAGSGGGMRRIEQLAAPFHNGQAPVRRAAVEFQYSVQTQAPDRRDLAEGRAVHVRRQVLPASWPGKRRWLSTRASFISRRLPRRPNSICSARTLAQVRGREGCHRDRRQRTLFGPDGAVDRSRAIDKPTIARTF